MKIALRGCCAEPLGSYLKGIAGLRLVSEQTDDEERNMGIEVQDTIRLLQIRD